ncbi:hypothetical protein C8R44DRAFT_947512 [Mycena epipterygia]|nr:hypothetical protein C8R44DRAFT_947512 [Mycena epipterygia]
MNCIADLAPDLNMLMFINEAAKNDRTTGCPKDWSLKGQRCIQRCAFVWGKHIQSFWFSHWMLLWCTMSLKVW